MELCGRGLMRGIVVFEIVDLKFDAKAKLSQNQKPAHRDNVVRQLQGSSSERLRALARYMEHHN